MSKFLDSNGLAYFWGKLKAYFVAKEVGKGLSTNDFTTAEKNKLAGIEAGAEVNAVTSVNGQTGAVTVPSAVMSDTAPLIDGTASAGISDEAARGDHVHPHDISLLPIDTATGNPVVIDAYPTLAEGLSVTFTPKQSGSGDPTPSNIRPISGYSDVELARYGKNLMPPNATDESKTYSGVTIKAENGVYRITGTATGNSYITFPLKQTVDISPSTNKIAFLNTSANNTLNVRFQRNGSTIHFWNMSSVNRVGSGWTDTGNEVIDTLQFSYSGGQTYDMTISPMLILLTEDNPTTFEPYISPVAVNVHVGGLGKNKCGLNASEATNLGWNVAFPFTIKAGTYIMSCQQQFGGTTNKGASISLRDADNNNLKTLTGYDFGDTLFVGYPQVVSEEAAAATTKLYFSCREGMDSTEIQSIVNAKIQIEEGSTATAYEPYFTIGGEYDVLEGELKVTYGYIASYNGESLPSKWISDRDVYAAGTTPTTGAEVAYELATPTVYAFTPQPFDMLDGTNTFITNTDSLTVSYRCEIQKYIQKLIAALA